MSINILGFIRHFLRFVMERLIPALRLDQSTAIQIS